MMKIPTILHNLFPSRNNSSNSSLILSSPNDGPTDNDVLCGRDRNFSKHPGNVLYRIQVEKYASAYALATTKQSKMKITKQIVHIMQSQYGSRFLRRVTSATATTNAATGRNSNSTNTNTSNSSHENNNSNQWEVLTNIQARDKTSHALRFINNNNSSTSSSRTDDDASSSAEQVQQQQQYRAERERDDEVVTSPTCVVTTTTTAEVGATSISQQEQQQKENMISSATNTNTTTTPTNHSIQHSVKTATKVDDSAIQAIHLRQQELLRCSLQNDCIMDVQNGTLTMEQLMQSPLFTMSGLSAVTTTAETAATATANHQHVHTNNNGSNEMISGHTFSDNRMMMSVMSTATGTTNDALDELFCNVTGSQNKNCHIAENNYSDNQLTTMMMMSYLQGERCKQQQQRQRDHAVIQYHDATTTQSYDNVMEHILSSRSQIMVLNHHDTDFCDSTNNNQYNEYHDGDLASYKLHDIVSTTNNTTATTTNADVTNHPSDFLRGGDGGGAGEDLDFLFNENSLSSLITTNMNLNDDDDDDNNNNNTDIIHIDPPLYDISM